MKHTVKKSNLLFLTLFAIGTVYGDTIRDFTKYGIYIKCDKKIIHSKKLKYGMEIDFSPKCSTMAVFRKDENGEGNKVATVPTSANTNCPSKIQRIGCGYTIGPKGPIRSLSKTKYNCMKQC